MSKRRIARPFEALPSPAQQAQGDAHPMFLDLDRAAERYGFRDGRQFHRFARRWGFPLCGRGRELRVETRVGDEFMRGRALRSA